MCVCFFFLELRWCLEGDVTRERNAYSRGRGAGGCKRDVEGRSDENQQSSRKDERVEEQQLFDDDDEEESIASIVKHDERRRRFG